MLVRSLRYFSILLCVWAATLLAQNPTATVVGIVRDATGALVPDASVEVRNHDTGQIRRVTADARGEYIVPNLPPGLYEVTVSKEGFRSVRETGIELQLDQEVRLDVKLEVGTVSQSVEVTATAPLINTENGTKGQVMTSNEIVEMPLNGRNINDLGFLAAGITPNNTNLQGSSFAINGARPDNTNFIIDGISSREPLFGAAIT